LGHDAILLFRTFIAQIRDPSEREEARKLLTKEEAEKNIETYEKQTLKILDFSKIQIVYNADWLSKLNFADVLGWPENYCPTDVGAGDVSKKD